GLDTCVGQVLLDPLEAALAVQRGRLRQRIGPRGAENRSASRQDAADRRDIEPLGVRLKRAAPAVTKTHELAIVIEAPGPDDRPDDCVQPRAVAASGQNPDAHLFLRSIHTFSRPDATLVPMSVLAIDAGTTGVTALIVSADGAVAGRGYAEFSQYFPRPGWVEQMPEEIWQATLTACAQALRAVVDGPEAVTCVGITNQRETAVVWDAATLSAPHRAIVWQDRRSARICAELRDAGHEDRVA